MLTNGRTPGSSIYPFGQGIKMGKGGDRIVVMKTKAENGKTVSRNFQGS